MLKQTKSVNVSLDIWKDATMRSFIGIFCHFITNEWQLLTIPCYFISLKTRHTAETIKNIYDEKCIELGIGDKVYKIVADQGSNVKKAFKSTISANDKYTNIVEEFFNMIDSQENNQNDNDQSESTTTGSFSNIELKLAEDTDEGETNATLSDSIDSTILNPSENNIEDNLNELAYLPCAAHNLQLAIKDSFKQVKFHYHDKSNYLVHLKWVHYSFR